MSGGSALDTIVAPATPPVRSALAMVRIDGPGAAALLAVLGGDAAVEPRVATLTELRIDGSEIDHCIAIRYAAPHSFTGNDLVELTLHGNPMLVERVIAAALSAGARMAEPGEFTERAVLNGKLDLVQAESIADLIAARTAAQAKLSLHNLHGLLSRTATSIRKSLLEVISRLEAALDFADEGYEFISREDARRVVEGALEDCARLADTFTRGRATTRGLSAVILGRPNAGKSTLLNRLVGSDRAIVTPIPGTTRDIIQETIEIGGLPVTLSDTAGLRTASDAVEEIGVERARAAAADAEIVLYLLDAAAGITAEDERELATLDPAKVLRVFTKIDLTPAPPAEFGISVTAETGIQTLLSHLDELVKARFAAEEESATLVNERQVAAVNSAAEALRESLGSIAAEADEQVVLVDLYRAANALALLTGAISRDDVYAEIFSKFCIGK